MRYQAVSKAVFLERPNRFIAYVRLDGQTVVCHVKNTGRCRELLVPGAVVYVEKSGNPKRKTMYDLIAVEKGERLINMDSQAPNKAAGEWLKKGGLFLPDVIKPEYRYGNSRFDFYLEGQGRKAFVEVKGVTLEQDGGVYFPDAPTLRGTKHVKELAACIQQGFEAYLLLVVQMENVRFFAPNDQTDPAFGKALREAESQGVSILAYDCMVKPDVMKLKKPVPVLLSGSESF